MSKEFKPITLSNKVIVSDPCYTRGIWCTGTFDNVKPGKYIPYLIYGSEEGSRDDTRVYELAVVHESADPIFPAQWTEADFEVGVDSGQAGVFCDSLYPVGENNGEYEEPNSFYGACCNATLGEGYRMINDWFAHGKTGPRPEWSQGDSVFDKGFVSCSGYGDGGYSCFFAVDDEDQIIAIKIVFMGEEAEEEDLESDFENDEE
jgi:hypothetical protein